MNDLIYWIWLSLACTPDTSTFSKLIESYDNAKDIYMASEREIRLCVGAKVSDCSALVNKDLTRAEEIYDFCKSKGVGIVTYGDDTYPELLKYIPTPPVLLYYRGKWLDFNKGFRCAVVGTRSLSAYGRTNAFKLGYDLGCIGATVVSGMAKGIDGVALAGAISAGAPTIAVIGSGIDVCYPSVHLTLAREIVKNGCVITEFAPGTKPDKFNFPRRNRIISGLSSATVVVEGRENSGSMITARHAMAQGRTVYAFPGNVGNEGSESTNLLIKNGAKLCTCAEDIINDFGEEFPGVLNPFMLKTRPELNMMQVLTEFKVSALTSGDDIYNPPRSVAKSRIKQDTDKAKIEAAQEISEQAIAPELPPMPEFSGELLKLYKKIPAVGDCSVESLADEECNLRTVMKLLLKLEMGKFVIMLPGDRVKRNML